MATDIQKSKIEKGAGNKDKVFSIKVKFESVEKGADVKIGDEVHVATWKAHTRIGIASIAFQGHESIPKKGQTATFHMKKNRKTFEPLMPNGMDIKPPFQKPGKVNPLPLLA